MLKCCIHIEGGKGRDNEETKQFIQKTLKRCEIVLKARNFHKMKYSKLKLPSSLPDPVFGYHSSCYALFTAIKSKFICSVPIDYIPGPSTSAESSLQTTSTAILVKQRMSHRGGTSEKRLGVLGDFCIFCRKPKLIYKTEKQKLIKCVTTEFNNNVNNAAEVLSDYRLKALLVDGDLVAKEAQYHKICGARYLAKAKRYTNQRSGPSTFTIHRNANAQAFEYLYNYIEDRIINDEQIFSSHDLFKVYKQVRKEIYPETSDKEVDAYPLRNFEENILLHFGTRILLDKRCVKQHIFFSASMDYKEGVIDKKLQDMSRHGVLRDAAFQLRNTILASEKMPLGSNITPEIITRGECDVPLEVVEFFQDVMRGPTSCDVPEVTKRRADSMAQDLVFCSTSGRVKPAKHLSLGSALKSLTSSKKVVTLMNRLGHSASYSTVEELETEMAYSALESSSILPANIQPNADLCTMVAFNNFDRFVETATGKDTLHDTVAVVYQNSNASFPSASIIPPSETGRKRRRRAFDDAYGDIPSYNKKPTKPFDVRQTIPTTIDASTIELFNAVDMAWMMTVAHAIPQTPMWVGFNARLFRDDLPQQKVAYLPQINHSPTSYSVVAHTLKISQNVADECGQHGIICAYDLNIARMALQIQNEEGPAYDDVFIMLGAFHIELSFFKALGKIIDSSGITEIIEECDLIAKGSLNAFLGGKHYNRCKRLHQYIAIALRVLNYQRFLRSCEENQECIEIEQVQYILQQMKHLNFGTDDEISFDPRIIDHIQKYKKFELSTMNGEHGATPQFWIKYVLLYDLYHNLTRSVRMGHTELFLSTLCSMTDIFFAINHHNYARWLVVFTDKLHEGLKKEDNIGAQLRKGIISVRRTKKNFSRTALDLTLEQTVNADAGNKMTGISFFTNSITARQRWAVSHSQRTQLISHVMEGAGITEKEDISRQLKTTTITSDSKNVQQLLEMFKNFLNPFSEKLNKHHLYNLTTGKSAAPEVQEYLINLNTLGAEQHKKFRYECSVDAARFNLPIKRNKMLNFPTGNIRLKVSKQGKIQDLKQERNMFARLLTISMENNIDLKSVFAYPLTPVPLSLSHSDGTMLTTPKSALLHHLESLCDHDGPLHQDVLIVDGFYYLHTISRTLPSSYGMIAEAILKKLSRMKVKTIHLVFDTYVVPSIKDQERMKRATTVDRFDQGFTILNPGQRIPSEMIKLLKIDQFKEAFVHFLTSEWSKDIYAPHFEHFTLFVNDKHVTFQFTKTDQTVKRWKISSYCNSHIEADSKMVYLLTKIREGNLVVKTSDTDVLIIILGNMHHISDRVQMWLETGSQKNNTLRFLNVNKINEHLGSSLSRALPAFHALTGCDYTASFYRLGKKKPFQIIKNNERYQSTLSQLGENIQLSTDEISSLHQIVCNFYTKKDIFDIDELRLQIFSDAFHKSSTAQPLLVRKGMEAASFPPCKKVLNQKFLRTKFVTLMWTNLINPDPPAISPKDYGWTMDKGMYQVRWYTGSCLPASLNDILCNTDESEEEDKDGEESSTYYDSDDED